MKYSDLPQEYKDLVAKYDSDNLRLTEENIARIFTWYNTPERYGFWDAVYIANNIEELPQIPKNKNLIDKPCQVDVDKLCNRLFGGSYEARSVESEEEADRTISFGIECFKAAQSLNANCFSFNKEDLKNFAKIFFELYQTNDFDDEELIERFNSVFENNIQSLQQTVWNVEVNELNQITKIL